nr:reverse transcriptase domain-containing protein [Tanacetum cinerariifolium]
MIESSSFRKTDTIERVKNKELNFRVTEGKTTFHIDKAMHYSHVNDDTCFSMDIIDDITEDELDALLDNSKPFLNTSKKISETSVNKEFDEFISENVQEDEVKDDFEGLPPEDGLRIEKSIQDLPTDLEMKPLLKTSRICFSGEKLSTAKFDIEIKNKKGAENVAVDYLSRLEKQNIKELNDEEINDEFPDEFLMSIKTNKEESPWFDDFGNYLVGGILRKGLTYIQRFKHDYPSGYVELYDKHGGSFIVNGHRVKLYYVDEQLNKHTIEKIHLMFEEGIMKAIPFMAPFPTDYRETMPWASEKPYIYNVVENTCNKAKLYDLDETGKGIVIKKCLYILGDEASLEKK